MTHEEKRAWIRLVAAVAGYATYVIIVAGRLGGRPAGEVSYAPALLWTIGGSIVATVVAEVVAAAVTPRAPRTKDVRDRDIGRLGQHVGQPFVVIGAVAGLVMALAEWDWFWIANVIYLCFALSAVLTSVTRVIVYRRSFPEW